MHAEYDLVVLGDSVSGRRAALYAARQHARVAFVQQHRECFPAYAVFQELANLVMAPSSLEGSFPFEKIADLRRWLCSRAEEVFKPYSLNRLAYNGVDILINPGHFIAPEKRTQCPIFENAGRQLRSRYYLLALDESILIETTQSQHSEWLSLEALLLKLESLTFSDEILIQGRHPWSILLGQILKKLGYGITLFDDQVLLSREDSDLAFMVQCQLESEGIRVDIAKTRAPVSPSTMILKPSASLALEGLKLQSIGIEWEKKTDTFAPQIIVNSRMETLNSQFYACGAVLGGYSLPRMAAHEVTIALDNLLFAANKSLHYEQIAYSLPLLPGLTRIGLTEVEARQTFQQIETMTRSMENTVASGSNCLFCKIIAKSTGEIVGLHLMGQVARDALTICENITREGMFVTDLGQCLSSSIHLQQIFHDFAHRWDRVQTPQKRDRLEQYFRGKRMRFS